MSQLNAALISISVLVLLLPLSQSSDAATQSVQGKIYVGHLSHMIVAQLPIFDRVPFLRSYNARKKLREGVQTSKQIGAQEGEKMDETQTGIHTDSIASHGMTCNGGCNAMQHYT